jgi:hypothetical protein
MLYPPATPRLVGLFLVTSIRPDPNGVFFTVPGGGLLRYDIEPDRMVGGTIRAGTAVRTGLRAMVRDLPALTCSIALDNLSP